MEIRKDLEPFNQWKWNPAAKIQSKTEGDKLNLKLTTLISSVQFFTRTLSAQTKKKKRGRKITKQQKATIETENCRRKGLCIIAIETLEYLSLSIIAMLRRFVFNENFSCSPQSKKCCLTFLLLRPYLSNCTHAPLQQMMETVQRGTNRSCILWCTFNDHNLAIGCELVLHTSTPLRWTPNTANPPLRLFFNLNVNLKRF